MSNFAADSCHKSRPQSRHGRIISHAPRDRRAPASLHPPCAKIFPARLQIRDRLSEVRVIALSSCTSAAELFPVASLPGWSALALPEAVRFAGVAMLVEEYAFLYPTDRLGHADVPRIKRLAMRRSFARTIVLDLGRVRDATVEAFADLILLRRQLLSRGRDLRLENLHHRAELVYKINRLQEVLPPRACAR
jgi:hypothetical protein